MPQARQVEPTLTGREVRRLMRKYGKTIAGLASSMNITRTRVRFVREHGVTGAAFVEDWLEALIAYRFPNEAACKRHSPSPERTA